MPDGGSTLTAATFVGAVLEQAGYMAQAEFLRNFRDFFREAGALLTIISALGGLVSITVFGSFRAARYMLLGPALFWFLVGPTYQIDAVIWQVGGGTPRGLYERRGEQVSKEDVTQVLGQSRPESENFRGPYEVAYVFALFTRVINSVTRDLSKVVLGDEKNYLSFVSRGRALNYLIGVEPQEPMLNAIISSNLAVDCREMLGYALAVKQTPTGEDSIPLPENPTAAQTRREFALINYNNAASEARVQLKDIRSKELGAYIAAYLRNKPNPPGVRDITPETVEQVGSISCGTVWRFIASAIQEEAEQYAKTAETIAQGDGSGEDSKREACQALEKKIFRNPPNNSNCDLQNAVSIFLLQNALLSRAQMASTARLLANNTVEGQRIRANTVVPLNHSNGFPTPRPFLPSGQTDSAATPGGPAQGLLGALDAPDIYNGKKKYRFTNEYFGGEPTVELEGTSSVKIQKTIGDATDAAFTELPKFNLRNLRQQLFHWSLHIPYWQGLLLYLITISYPFMALVVLIPGRAASFINLPLAWLWVKSWDLGYSVVMVFERVLWNIFPNANIDPKFGAKGLNNWELWEILQEANKFDHTWNLHLYYSLLAMATMSIPAVMAYGTIKAKRAVLANFTDRITSDMKASGQMARQGEQMAMATARSQTMRDFRRAAIQSVGQAGSPVANAGGPGGAAQGTGIPAQMVYGNSDSSRLMSGKFANQMAFFGGLRAVRYAQTALLKNTSNPLQRLSGGAIDSIRAGLEMHRSQYDYEVAMAKFDHPVFGRYGNFQMRYDALAASYDTSGGMEMFDDSVTAVNESAKLFAKQLARTAEEAGGIFGLAVQASASGVRRIPLKAFSRASRTAFTRSLNAVGIASVIENDELVLADLQQVSAVIQNQANLNNPEYAGFTRDLQNVTGAQITNPSFSAGFVRDVFNIRAPSEGRNDYANYIKPEELGDLSEGTEELHRVIQPMNSSNYKEFEVPYHLVQPSQIQDLFTPFENPNRFPPEPVKDIREKQREEAYFELFPEAKQYENQSIRVPNQPTQREAERLVSPRERRQTQEAPLPQNLPPPTQADPLAEERKRQEERLKALREEDE